MPVPPLNTTALLKSHDPSAPIHMLNLFKHRPQAVFPSTVHPSINTTGVILEMGLFFEVSFAGGTLDSGKQPILQPTCVD